MQPAVSRGVAVAVASIPLGQEVLAHRVVAHHPLPVNLADTAALKALPSQSMPPKDYQIRSRVVPWVVAGVVAALSAAVAHWAEVAAAVASVGAAAHWVAAEAAAH